MNPNRNHEVAGTILASLQRVKELALLLAVVKVADTAWNWCCYSCGKGCSDWTPSLGTSIYPGCGPKKQTKKKKKKKKKIEKKKKK